MLEQSTMHPVVWINQHTYISIVKNADYNLEVWEITAENRQHRMARMNYKYLSIGSFRRSISFKFTIFKRSLIPILI